MEKEKPDSCEPKQEEKAASSWPSASVSKYATIKLTINTKNHQVIYAQGGRDVIDFLFELLSSPVAAFCRLITEPHFMGNLGFFFKSIEKLFGPFIAPVKTKGTIPIDNPFVKSNFDVPWICLPDDPLSSSSTKTYYRCGNRGDGDGKTGPGSCGLYFSDGPRAFCPNCLEIMSAEAIYVAPTTSDPAMEKKQESVPIRDVSSFMILDNLEIRPFSTISAMALLKELKLEDLDCLEERIVDIGVDEGLDLVTTAISTKGSKRNVHVLTSVFLKKTSRPDRETAAVPMQEG
ncbi:OLC1v1007855C1 [Oldenlandia corymbosa var. corymbosa]|uniref:OLC1v1007855C1 n=1 Tax=Oldenlandia corymbosa var. corymbosa TaxID=529605 RepID=A0AAV1DLP5_OLDCO|nr:OLC1v1007855C1 [Oldenlandia corymbosa var. corymbosa]